METISAPFFTPQIIRIATLGVLIGILCLAACETTTTGQIPTLSKEARRNYSPEEQQVFAAIQRCDSQLFAAVFGTCDSARVRALISADLEFYHDKSGITNSSNNFLLSIAGICSSEFHPSRELQPGSMEIFLLKNNDSLYGVVQTGMHTFYEKPSGQSKQLRSTARFTHLWVLEKSNWKLKRVLSYDHQVPEVK